MLTLVDFTPCWITPGKVMQTLNKSLWYWEQLSCLRRVARVKEQLPKKAVARIYLGKQFPNVYWTRREAECVYYVAKSKKRRSIANLLGLSVRTIDSYMETAKAKLNCRSQQELLAYIAQTDFLENVQHLVEDQQ